MDRELIKRYLKGECTPEEKAEIRKLMSTGEAESLFDDVLNEGWNDGEPTAEDNDAQQLAAWKERFAQKLKEGEENIVKPSRNYNWLKYAAIWAVFILIAGTTYTYYKKGTEKQPVIAMQETINPNGKLIKIKLSDSSTVTLNAASKLKYPEHFDGKTREVYLEGEAFFDVAHDPAHPFIVHTSKIKVSVLGTSFNVRSYGGDKKVTVAVATGKVGVLAKTEGSITYFVLPGEKIAYNLTDTEPNLSKIAVNEIGAWQNGMLVYHNETLENISRQLERWYNVKIIIKKDELKQMRFNFKQKNDRLENVMKTLQFAGGVHYAIDAATVTIW
ncbi:FecR domain-containing protein [Mucilaginibacter gynuensis]|uniref:FecR domain-containing protein n=1 Tax=Mucilaginibacter gynuensis TaxID=1302236 RepID=A0ABP8FWD0_9SPHI